MSEDVMPNVIIDNDGTMDYQKGIPVIVSYGTYGSAPEFIVSVNPEGGLRLSPIRREEIHREEKWELIG